MYYLFLNIIWYFDFETSLLTTSTLFFPIPFVFLRSRGLFRAFLRTAFRIPAQKEKKRKIEGDKGNRSPFTGNLLSCATYLFSGLYAGARFSYSPHRAVSSRRRRDRLSGRMNE
jgi:hypothetical protein